MVGVRGVLLTFFYYRTRNQTLLILAHFVIDGLALVGAAVMG